MRNKIRVLNIQETIASGGVERTRISLAKLLNKEVFDLKIICTHAEGPMLNEFEDCGVEVIPIGLLNHTFEWRQHRKVQKIIEEFKPHIIHGAVFEGVTMATINGFLKSVPIIIIEETSDPQNRSWKGNLLMKLFSIVADKVVGVSPASVQYLKTKLKLSDRKVQLINNGVAIPKIINEKEKWELRKQLGIKDSEVVIGTVGRMIDDSHKRFSDLIKAFAVVAQNNTNVKLILIGDGREKYQYQKLVKQLAISDKVIFAGFQHDTAKFYGTMDIFSLVSAREAFGLVLVEAMLHKLPIVATRVGGMQYIVEDNKTGFLVNKSNLEEMSERLSKLCQDKNLRIDMGKKGYQKAINEYTEERYVANVEEMYMNLLKTKKLI